jgi:hypothetical protein
LYITDEREREGEGKVLQGKDDVLFSHFSLFSAGMVGCYQEPHFIFFNSYFLKGVFTQDLYL